jgi:hypothetical protein
MSEPKRCPFSVANTNDVDPFSLYEQVRPDGPLVWDEGMSGVRLTWERFYTDFRNIVGAHRREN